MDNITLRRNNMENTSVSDLQKEINKEEFDIDKEIKIVRVQYFRKKK